MFRLPRDDGFEMRNPFGSTPFLMAFGLLAFGLAGLSIADMFVPRPYDGVVLDVRAESKVLVEDVLSGSAADLAGIRRGDQILGIGRQALRGPAHAARVLTRFRVGDEVPYLVKSRLEGVLHDRWVKVERRRIGDGAYIYACTLGFSFFFLGVFVLVRQPTARTSRAFFVLCGLFLLFLVCRMRPPSYSGIDTVILGLGTLSFLLLPPAFLNFYVLFPRPVWETLGAGGERAAILWRRWRWLLFAVPLALFLALRVSRAETTRGLGDAPTLSWWLLALYMAAGLAALARTARGLEEARERRGVVLVLLGSVVGIAPFLVASLLFSEHRHSTTFFFLGIMPLILVPITFTYAIVRFQLLDIRVILQKSLLYTVTTALITGLYAGGIATFNSLFRGTSFAASGWFPFVLALAIFVLFEPLRRAIQKPIDAFFFAGRSGLQKAMMELGEAVAAQTDLRPVVEELVERLPRLLGLRFAALYLRDADRLVRVAGPGHLPEELDVAPALGRHLDKRSGLLRLEQMGALALRSPAVAKTLEGLSSAGVEALGDLATPRRRVGWVVLSEREGQIPLDHVESELLQGLLHQVALALETSLLLEERTQQAELEREMEIAASIQAQLLPDDLEVAAGWDVAACCRPASVVGGDFYAQLPAPDAGDARALVYGDVSGKSVSGALMMMAAHEALHALALTEPRPGRLFELANRRVYAIGRRRFVALGYFCPCTEPGLLRYVVAGQPPPLHLGADGRVVELDLPRHRIPVGALPQGEYDELVLRVAPGEVVLGYSDGVTDALSPEGDVFGFDRLHEVVGSIAPGSAARDVIDHVLCALDDFTRGAAQYDDVTLVVLSRLADASAGSSPT